MGAYAHKSSATSLPYLRKEARFREEDGYLRLDTGSRKPSTSEILKILPESEKRGLGIVLQSDEMYLLRSTISKIIGDISTAERNVLTLISEGKRNKEIGAQLYISESTVKMHVHNILGKKKAKNRIELAITDKKTTTIEEILADYELILRMIRSTRIHLSPKLRQVCQLVMGGKDTKEISQQLNISYYTACTYIRQACNKTSTSNKLELALWYKQHLEYLEHLDIMGKLQNTPQT